MIEQVQLVDSAGRTHGVCEKMEAHRLGLLHRAFSIFVFNSSHELMLQRRAETKYHCGGLWSNTCCSHPRPGEGVVEAGRRRIREEMGFSCELKEVFRFEYRAEVGGGLIEHELDHVLFGEYEGSPHPNPEEVGEWKWIDPGVLEEEISADPDGFTPWLRFSLPRVLDQLRSIQNSEDGLKDNPQV